MASARLRAGGGRPQGRPDRELAERVAPRLATAQLDRSAEHAPEEGLLVVADLRKPGGDLRDRAIPLHDDVPVLLFANRSHETERRLVLRERFEPGLELGRELSVEVGGKLFEPPPEDANEGFLAQLRGDCLGK